ncbi:MAG: CU044_2847 family protein [Desulfobacteraceae bacterium]|jgi:hypothetical protein
MGTRLIELKDGTLVEIEASADEPQLISGGIADKVDATFEKIKPFLLRSCRPITEAWQDVNRQVKIEQAEIELGLSFEGEGNLFVTRSKAGANIAIKLILKPRE